MAFKPKVLEKVLESYGSLKSSKEYEPCVIFFKTSHRVHTLNPLSPNGDQHPISPSDNRDL